MGNVWVCLYMLFVTSRVLKIVSACARGSKRGEGRGALGMMVCHSWESELEVFVPQSKHSSHENARACSTIFLV